MSRPFLGYSQALLGKPLPAELAYLTTSVGVDAGSRVIHAAAVQRADSALDLVIIRTGTGGFVLELTPQLQQGRIYDAAPLVSPTLKKEEDGIAARQALIEQIARLTAGQRVMFYFFHADGHGEVLAEVCARPDLGSYLGLHFPASDIPQIARALYLKNPWRLIADASAQPVPLLAAGDTPQADLTWSDLRSVSPVHCQYLANMGVRSSLSFTVAMSGQLVALITVHFNQPSPQSLLLLEHIAALVRTYTFRMTSWQSQQRIRLIDGLIYRFAPIQHMLGRHGDFIAAWPEMAAWLMDEFQVSGATLCVGDSCYTVGRTFAAHALAFFDDWFCNDQNETLWFGESLARQLSGFPLSECVGVLALSIGQEHGGRVRLYMTRTEYIYEISWGGNPNKPAERNDSQWGLAPRRSFEKWVEKRLGYCRPWDSETRLLAIKLRELLLQELR